MPIMSIISCKIMQDEIVWILENDSSINEIIVVENENIREFTEKLNKVNLQYKVFPLKDISSLPEIKSECEKYTVLIHLMKLGLHSNPKELKNKVYEIINILAPFSSGILLFYGLCGNVMGNVEKDFEVDSLPCTVRILKDKNHRIVDDCIGATVGGVNNYLRILKSVSDAGTYLFTPMYSKGWRELLQLDRLNRDPAKALKLMKKTHEMIGYKRVAKINTGLEYTENFDASIREFAELFDFEILEFDDGNQKIFEDCYNELKVEIGANKSD
ncbi:hypothetical protein MSHOH_2305 [Methanosarcina horonobensis HB-1 = JCM 15518]|uniref:DUF1638 domain-containing protein n=1 Tax=Methanosarcina horonobensis HB-1 = JCM 15518 TaxID=1434110 RepID=A0A0E3SGS3_9EURY|nr:DUF1638 domain-containing protein [Methanosarcina horonobensis]AKB78788.1 hypothetical protein MSHOH_2305 [Methanosarcina horonobensis HB-1 = JCM 15518]